MSIAEYCCWRIL